MVFKIYETHFKRKKQKKKQNDNDIKPSVLRNMKYTKLHQSSEKRNCLLLKLLLNT